jgi:hypothetical protein
MKKFLFTLTGVSAMMTALLAQPPVNLEVCEGKGYTLTSTKDATGASSVTYQWYENSNLLTGKDEATLTIAEGQAEAGDYAYVRVAANDDCPGVPSNTFTVRVRQPGADGERPDAMCGCASGLNDCSGTCQTLCCSNCVSWTLCDNIFAVTNSSSAGQIPIGYAAILCESYGMRLPTLTELQCMCANKNSLPGGYDQSNSGYYWSSTPHESTDFNVILFRNCARYGTAQGGSYFVKCVL